MQIWTALVAREAALLALLTLIGAGPASYLGSRFGAAGRLALAPVLGFCVGTCVTTTLVQFAPTDDTWWVLIPLAVASAAVAVWRARRTSRSAERPGRPSLTDLLALAVVIVAVAGPTTYVMHERHSTGPAVYTYTDVDNYVAVQDAARTVSLSDARTDWHRIQTSGRLPRDLQQFVWAFIADLGSNLDATPLDSNVNALLGLHATDTFAPFLIVLLLMASLGGFAAVRYFSRSRTWMAVLSGCLFGGPLFLELWFDSYQAAIVALSLSAPLVLVAHSALETRQRSDLVLLALLLATLLTVYPLYIVLFVLCGGAVLVWMAAMRRRRGEALRPALRPLVGSLLALGVLAVVFDLVGVLRDLRYYKSVLEGTTAFARVTYHLPLSVLPGWLGQTREFWDMPTLGHADAKQLILGAAVPLVFAAFVGIGAWRFRPSAALVVLAAICAVLAEYSYLSQHSCTYCAERDLLPLGPIIAIMLGLGLCAVAADSRRNLRVVAGLATALAVVVVGQRARIELKRFANGSYFLDAGARNVAGHIPHNRGSVQQEGFGASLYAQAEQPLIYHMLVERVGARASILLADGSYNQLQYLDFGTPATTGPTFDPDYRYVLTRLGGVRTNRRVIARSGPFALEMRTSRLDITPISGLGLTLARLDPSGLPWVQTQSPLRFYITGANRGRPVWARLHFRVSVTTKVPAQPGVTAAMHGKDLVVCARASGSVPVRTVSVQLAAAVVPGTSASGLFPPAEPLEGVALTAMRAVSGHCTPS